MQKCEKLVKGCVLGHIDKFWKGHDRQIKKNACKNAYLGSIFIPEKYVIGVLLFESMVEPDTPPLAIRVPPRLWGMGGTQVCSLQNKYKFHNYPVGLFDPFFSFQAKITISYLTNLKKKNI